jgi:diaminopimelate decarboxylase
LYFLKGNDHRELNLTQSKEILNIVESSDLTTSAFVYNNYELRRKYHSWMKALPWIKPHYAIKSNPSIPLLQDLIE